MTVVCIFSCDILPCAAALLFGSLVVHVVIYNIELPLIDEFLLFAYHLIVWFSDYYLLTCLSFMVSCCWMQEAKEKRSQQVCSNSKRYVHYLAVLLLSAYY